MEIRDLGQDTYLIGRRVIKAGEPGQFDLSKQADRDELVRIAEGAFKTKFSPAPYGELTVIVPTPIKRPVPPQFEHEVSKTAKYIGNCMHFGNLHDEAKEILRKEFPEYADKI